MATSVLTAASDHHHHPHQTTTPSSSPSSPPHDHHTVRRTSGRKKQPNKGSEKIKKQPQRGMGVEKLERLRLQKRWEKMTQPPTANHHHHHANFNIINTAAAATPFSDPVNLFGSANSLLPLRFGGYGAPIVGHMGLNPNPNPNPTQQSYHLGFHGQTAGVIGLAPDFFTKNVNLMIHNKEQLSSSSSSSPNVFLNCYSEHCNSCHKKKKVINSENSGRVTRSDIYTNSGDYGFLGLSIGDNNPNSTGHETQGVEVVAVHRRGPSRRSEGGRSTVLMEYEFFPAGKGYGADDGGGSDSSNNDDDELTAVMKMAAAGGGSETTTTSSSSTMAATGFQTSDFIDLSLKLSY
ncbi:hypothetical protein ABFS82_13G176800 [Erythranthe guttata]|uniref:uncharacterized protein LOC105948740 n=1 Tax=Erythranthe guttata TaxID=4155 RepID=UPI00064DDADC|nr:PREDICTED: uncharacterized protein LOC105948740 [Erythranthe guttata]|eukprot:XP_012827421.1 PREDICTED: uncharacterized protein LOC105948740 [Erythranthe guttata]